MVALGAATAAVIIYYYVNRDDEEEMTENTEDTTGPVVFVENSNSNVLADQNTTQSPAVLSTHQSGTSSSHESPENACATCETETDRGEAEQEEMGLFIPEPMLCCEAEEDKVPHSLETLYETAQCNSTLDCLLLAAHVFLLETGFLPQGCDVRAGEMPSTWNATEGLCRLWYFHPFCENSSVQMVGVLMGQKLVINGTMKTNSAVEISQKLVLNPDDYVTKEWAGGNAGLAYRDMQKLSRVFKDHLVYPLIAKAREALGLPALFGLTLLPPELLLSIMQLLDVPSILNLSQVCRHLHSVSQDASLWKHFVYRDFGDGTEHRDTNWNELYKKKYQQKKAWHIFRLKFYASRVSPFTSYPPVPVLPLPTYHPPGFSRRRSNQRPAFSQAIQPRPPYARIGLFLGYEPPTGLPQQRPEGSRASDTRRGFI
ncbi:hypothetical protein Q7C36_015322 [Tachysurus vachellii]|uniref:F-box domain-containing protein n=1 Tax=Tachysurus vachellii TaxID=175792 RepID=A0AA88MBW1_TACVA|nr:hypothetical protein Q7C36_015322 [Tachysurus vachellii]